MAGGPVFTLVGGARAAGHQAPHAANERRGRCRTAESSQESATVDVALCLGSAAGCALAGFPEPVVHPAEGQSPRQKGRDNPGAVNKRATWYPVHLLLDEQS